MLFGNKKNHLIIFIFFIFFYNSVYALENKIVIKVNNEIVTSLDLNDEINYLMALNKNIRNLEKQKIYNIAKNSLIREKIKEMEILNYMDELKLDKEISNQVLKSTYSRIGINSKEAFLRYIQDYNVNINTIEKKISIEAIWNQLIVSKFKDKIKINKNELEKRILIRGNEKIKIYLLSEILFNISNDEKLEIKFKKIEASILDLGFENTALTYSISDSSKIGGKLDWIKESSLNKKIRNDLNIMNIGDLTKPIVTPGGFLLLKIEDVKFQKKKFDLNSELKNLIKVETNIQLNQYSNIYFNKIAKNFEIDEL